MDTRVTNRVFALLCVVVLAGAASDALGQQSLEVFRGGEVFYGCGSNDDCNADQICYPPTNTCQPRCAVNCLVPDPVCGTDGKTYVCGPDDAHCNGVEVAHPGECEMRGCWKQEHCRPDEVCNWLTKTCQEPCEVKCRRERPVCGRDGVTYRCGIFEAICNGTLPVSRGPCPDPCVCPDVYDPVCGVDGNTYGNACEARCAGVRIKHRGECRDLCRSNADCPGEEICFPPTDMCQPECQILCLVPDPVCGTDGVTYDCGEADAHCSGVEVAHPGSCDLCACPDVWDPVCGVDGTTYGNACEARCAGVEIAGPGECICRPPPCVCPRIYAPVCGVDGMTYSNACEARCASVEIAYEGRCRDCVCPQVAAPVCGVDGVTYGNACEAACVGVAVAHRGFCGQPPMCRSNDDCRDNEVCGCAPLPGCPDCEIGDESLRPEICILGCVIPNPCGCPAVYEPVCGADYRTYPNKCEAACRGVPIRHEGECRGPLPLATE